MKWQRRKGSNELAKIAARVKARREYIKANGAGSAQGKDIDHKRPLSTGGSGTLANLRAVTPATNRSFSRNANGSLKSQTSKKERKRKTLRDLYK